MTVGGQPARILSGNRFEGEVQVGAGTASVPVVATDGSGNARTYTYNVSVAGTTKTLTYDANGNLLSDGTRTYQWDALDQLTAINQGTHRSEFTYDSDGRRARVIERESGVMTDERVFVWCGADICQERTPDGLVTKRFGSLGVQESAGSLFYSWDHLGTVWELTDSTGSVRARYGYDPYGRRTKIAGDLSAPQGFTGHHVHEPSGLHLAPFRAYGSDLGRWMNQDPAGLSAGLNLYSYVKGRPTNRADPLGLDDDQGAFRCNRSARGWQGSSVTHTFICVVRNGYVDCGGQVPDPTEELDWCPFWPVKGGAERPGPRTMQSATCEEVARKGAPQDCLERCLRGRINNPARPTFAIGPLGSDCKEWADDTIAECIRECGGNPDRPYPRPAPPPPPYPGAKGEN